MSQDEAGEKLGVSGATVSRWESAQHVPTKSHLHAMEELYGLSFGSLMYKFVGMALQKKLHERIEGVRELSSEYDNAIIVGVHTVELTPDGDLLVNGDTLILAP